MTESLPRNIASAHETGQTETNQTEYPPRANTGVRAPDRTRYYDTDGKVIRVGTAVRHGSRQETQADHRLDADDLTARFASMGAQRGMLEGNEQSMASRHSANDSLSTQPTLRDRRASSRPRSHSRDPSQQADHDTRTASAGTHMRRYYPQSSNIVMQEEKSKSREQPVIRQLEESDNIDRESTGRPVQGQRKDSLELQQAHRRPNELPRKQPQRAVSNDGSLQRHQTINNSRRPSVTQGPGLPTISESELLKTTKIMGDNTGSTEALDKRKFPWI